MNGTLHTYTPYGHTQNRNSQLGFNGYFCDAVSGLYPLGNGYRMYSPTRGRFYSPDNMSPFGKGGMNTYTYCQGDPINKVDRNGHFTEVFKGAVVTIKRLLIPGDIPVENFPPVRKQLHSEVDRSTQWGKAIVAVNDRLGSHGDTNIPLWKAKSYIHRSKSAGHLNSSPTTAPASPTMTKNRSESSLFFSTVPEWYQVAKEAKHSGSNEQAGAAVVGVVANSLGGLIGSAHDHAPYKKGTIFYLPTDEAADIRK